jgi:hypothetical protein
MHSDNEPLVDKFRFRRPVVCALIWIFPNMQVRAEIELSGELALPCLDCLRLVKDALDEILFAEWLA